VRRPVVAFLPPLRHQRDPGRHQFKPTERKPRELPGVAQLPGQPSPTERARPGPRSHRVPLVRTERPQFHGAVLGQRVLGRHLDRLVEVRAGTSAEQRYLARRLAKVARK
jgi:hypothetical protein